MNKYKVVNKEYEILSDKINVDSIIISLISDLHYSSNSDKNIIDAVMKNIDVSNPDFITIPGDLIDDSNLSEKEVISVVEMVKSFSEVAPVIISLGNHDYMSKNEEGNWIYKSNDIFKSTISNIDNVYLLDNDTVNFEKLGISFSGHTFPFSYYEKDKESAENYKDYLEFIKFKNVQALMDVRNFRCSLVHSPINLLSEEIISNKDSVLPVDLILSGHMHGGMVPSFLDKFGSHYGLISPHMKPFPPYVRDLIKCNDNTQAIVSTGVFKTGNALINSLCKPEVNKILIKGR